MFSMLQVLLDKKVSFTWSVDNLHVQEVLCKHNIIAEGM